MAGEDAAVGDGLQLAVVQMTAILHEIFEPGVGILDDRFQRGAGFWRLVGSKPSGAALSGVDFTVSTLTPILSSRSAKVGKLEQHADRTDQRRLLGNDMIAGEAVM